MTAEPVVRPADYAPHSDHAPLVKLLGPLELSWTAAPTAGRERQLLALLAMRVNEVVSAAQIMDELFWRPVRKPLVSVQTWVYHLRKVQRLDIKTVAKHSTAVGYTLCMPSPLCVDVKMFERLANGGRREFDQGNMGAADTYLRSALDFWRGPGLVDVGRGRVLTAHLTELEERRRSTMHLRFEVDLRLGRHRSIVDELAAQVRTDPAREDFVALHALALYRSDRQVDALAAVDRCQQFLDAEYGLRLGSGLKGLRQQILCGDPALEWVP